MRSVVEFFTLFLTEHVAPLPSTPLGSPSYTAWRKKLEDQADAAWCRFVRFWQEKKRVQRALPSEALSPFDSFMKTVSPEHWPEGPSGSTLFQPKGSENQNRRMRDRSELVEAWHEEQAKKSKK